MMIHVAVLLLTAGLPACGTQETAEDEGMMDESGVVEESGNGFTGLDSAKLPEQVGDQLVYETDGYDAGTEINTEDFADMVPPCPPLTGVPSTDPGTGMSNPALAENGVIGLHPGVTGGVDLLVGLHGWTDPVARVTIRRID